MSVSPGPPRMTSWWATRPRARTACTRTPSTSAPRAPSRPVEVASGIGASPASRRAAATSSAVRRDGAARRVGLVGVVQLDDLDRLVEGRGCGGEAHHQHRADREVGRDQDPDPRGVGQRLAERVEPLVVEAGRADHAVQAVADAPAQVVHHHVGMGEVDDDLGRRSARPETSSGVDAAPPARGRRPPRRRGTPRCRPCPRARARPPCRSRPLTVPTYRAPAAPARPAAMAGDADAGSGRLSHASAADPGPRSGGPST